MKKFDEKDGNMRNYLTIIMLFSVFFTANSSETECECECHKMGGAYCNKCEDFHQHDECRCDCHSTMNATWCSNCRVYHEYVEDYGIDYVNTTNKQQNLQKSSAYQQKKKTQHQHCSHPTAHSSNQPNR